MTHETIPSLLDRTDPDVRAILGRVLDGQEISWQEALRLCETSGVGFQATGYSAE